MLCMDTFTQKWNTLVMLVSNRPYQQRPYMTSYTVSAITASRVLHSLFVNGQQRLDVKRWTWMKETPNSDLLREGINWRVYFRLGSECRNTVKGPAGEATVLRWTTTTGEVFYTGLWVSWHCERASWWSDSVALDNFNFRLERSKRANEWWTPKQNL